MGGVYYFGSKTTEFEKALSSQELPNYRNNSQNQYAILDLRDKISQLSSMHKYEKLKKEIYNLLPMLYENLSERRFITIFAQNIFIDGQYIPAAWDFAKMVSQVFSLKDEKIGCFDEGFEHKKILARNAGSSCFYSLHFRKDELSDGVIDTYPEFQYANVFKSSKALSTPTWFILKPQRRNREEILHPAKYPEELVELFVEAGTSLGDNIFDPMSGTGSTQLGSMKCGRNGYGIELSPFFANIAIKRCSEFVDPSQADLFGEKIQAKFKIITGDSRNFREMEFPKMNMLFTSPPYWDMLNMKGAENQAKRIEKGLQTNYSDDESDLGNISSYTEFVENLCRIYIQLISILKPGSYITIVVKNIKKKGSNYPFAWDIAQILKDHLELLPENFWLQDDISIAPFGYGNTWVSNTFHQYCLNFRVPANV